MKNLFVKLEVLGQFERPFFIYKIRSMYLNASKDFLELKNERGLDSLGKVINDPRVTYLGKIIRRYFIDELPQIYNLLVGDLSLVGIRSKSKEGWIPYPERHKKKL